MPIKSEQQRRFMAMCLHSPEKAKDKCPPKNVAKKFIHGHKKQEESNMELNYRQKIKALFEATIRSIKEFNQDSMEDDTDDIPVPSSEQPSTEKPDVIPLASRRQMSNKLSQAFKSNFEKAKGIEASEQPSTEKPDVIPLASRRQMPNRLRQAFKSNFEKAKGIKAQTPEEAEYFKQKAEWDKTNAAFQGGTKVFGQSPTLQPPPLPPMSLRPRLFPKVAKAPVRYNTKNELAPTPPAEVKSNVVQATPENKPTIIRKSGNRFFMGAKPRVTFRR